MRAGRIYYVRDDLVAMPPEDNRTRHNSRTVLIVSGDIHNDSEEWMTVAVCPVSSGSLSNEFDVKIGQA